MALLGGFRSRRLVSATAAWFVAAISAAAAPPTLEYSVKANYLFKFTPFVDWPARAFANPTSPFTVCIVGQDPFGSALDEAVRGQAVGDHPVEVRRTAVVEPLVNCQMLYAGRSTQSTAEMLKAVAGKPVLTVTEAKGGMIQFVTQNGKVRFDVDAAQAQAAGLIVSSKLLGLAVSNRRAIP